MRNLDFSSWHAVLTTLLGLAFITLIGVGVRLFVMQIIQRRRERENRQINERLRTLIAAYKTLGGSFTGTLHVDPRHLRDSRRRQHATDNLAVDASAVQQADETAGVAAADSPSAERARRVRDAVEAALSDIILLGTEEQVVLAVNAATELASGRTVHLAELVVSLRNFIRQVLDLDPVPEGLTVPRQGPARVAAGGSRGKGDGGGSGGGRGGGGAGGGGMGMGMGVGMGMGAASDDRPDPPR
ncbi:hypothetical protein ACMHYO_08135 [Allopusillimonas ginsengisoli]|uniref:hypothetical protein n=1 Tax=Allopusillimonas ginsengisoli TaxID=453575 RepID=UPI001485AEEB